MKTRIILACLVVAAISGCQAPAPKPSITDDTIVSSEVNGTTLTHRHAVTPPREFKPINKEYRALYGAAVMSTPGFGGNEIRRLQPGGTYNILGQVENFWMAVAERGRGEMIGYVPLRSVVPSERYEQTIKRPRPVRRAAPKAEKKNDCVAVGSSGTACRNADSGTWIID